MARAGAAGDLTPPTAVRWRSVALPIEHGAWGFLLEPALLGLLVAASGAGVALVVAALAALLLQTPLSIFLVDVRRGRRYPRTRLAARFAAVYAAALALAGALALWQAGSAAVLLPALLAAPLVGVQLAFDARHRGRDLLPEAAGATAMGALAACVALAGGVSLLPALGLWALLAARTVPSIVYVRARLRLERGRGGSPWPTWLTHAAALLGVAAAALVGAIGVVAALPYAVLAARAAVGLSSRRAPTPARVIGFRELAFGVLVAVGVALGFPRVA